MQTPEALYVHWVHICVSIYLNKFKDVQNSLIGIPHTWLQYLKYGNAEQ